LQRPAEIWGVIGQVDNVPRTLRFLQTIGRMKPGVTIDAAQADLAVIAGRLAQSYPETNKDWSVRVEPLRTGVMSATLQNTSLFLLGVVCFVLLLCCANIANLLLARGNARARELAVRAALGAGRSRMVSQMLTESLVLAALGGVLGVAIGATIVKGAPLLIPPGLLPAAATFTFDNRVAFFCASAPCARRRRGRSRGGAAVRRRVAAAHTARPRQRRHRLPRRRRQRAHAGFQRAGPAPGHSLSGPAIADAVLRCGLPRDQRDSSGSQVRVVNRSPLRHNRNRTPAHGDRRRSTSRPGQSSACRLSGGRSRLLRHDRSPDDRRAWLHRSRYRRQSESRHRPRGVRASLPWWTGSHRDAHQDRGTGKPRAGDG